MVDSLLSTPPSLKPNSFIVIAAVVLIVVYRGSLVLQNTVQSIDKIKKLLSVDETFMTSENREFATKAQTIIAKRVDPLFDGAKMFGKTATMSLLYS